MEPSSSGLLGALVGKFGLVKVLGFGSALVGAGVMALFRPPRDRIEVFKQGAAALGGSFMFGGAAVRFLDYQFDWINLATAPLDQAVEFNMMVYGLIGALSWGLFGGLAVLRDKAAKDPIGAVKDVKDAIS